jgi:hypothetical protein
MVDEYYSKMDCIGLSTSKSERLTKHKFITWQTKEREKNHGKTVNGQKNKFCTFDI